MAVVNLREGEDPEGLLKRFQTSMQRSGILRELRNRRFFRTKGEQTRLDKQRSLRRMRRRRRPILTKSHQGFWILEMLLLDQSPMRNW